MARIGSVWASSGAVCPARHGGICLNSEQNRRWEIRSSRVLSIGQAPDGPAMLYRRPVTTLATLRRFAVSRSLFPPTPLSAALDTLGFVQADPIRAPARAQDLTLRHRVAGYRAGDLERRYAQLPIEEDVFINYGFVTRTVHALMHPRTTASL